MNVGPIVIVDADLSFCQLYTDIINAIGVDNELRFFDTSQKALDYLKTTDEKPFIIFSEINLPGLNGLKLKEAIQADGSLREKGIPFIFISTNIHAETVHNAHQLNVQGYFEKPRDLAYVEQMMVKIFEYWELCKHINNT